MFDLARTGARLCAMAWMIVVSLADYALNVFLRHGDSAIRSRLAWVNRTARRLVKVVNLQVTSTGRPPRRGLLVSNHLGYLDIVVFNAISPMIFVSKAEVRDWPVFGLLATMAGTHYIDRTRKLDVERVSAEMGGTLNSGVVVALFPEGTSSDGSCVLPFRSSLLEPAASQGWPVTPASISYHLPGGGAGTDVCYWGDMDFLTHLVKLLSKKVIHVTVAFGEPVEACRDRKRLAAGLHEAVAGLKHPEQAGAQAASMQNAVGQGR
jgi:1-acyl-sn-glycerol-3-phosphate acyltransferase